MVTRASVVRWFELPPHAELRSGRIARALEEHGKLLAPAIPMRKSSVLSREDGISWIAEHGLDPTPWRKALNTSQDQARQLALEHGRADSVGLFAQSGTSLSLRHSLITTPQPLREVLGDPGAQLSPEDFSRLDERLMWELGAMFLCELVSDLMGPNPISPLLTVYEEGLYPLDLTPDGLATLWAPTASA